MLSTVQINVNGTQVHYENKKYIFNYYSENVQQTVHLHVSTDMTFSKILLGL